MRKFLLLVVLLGLVAWGIWPTRYQTFRNGEGPYADRAGQRATRVDRITGDAWVLQSSGDWAPLSVQEEMKYLRPDITGPRVSTQPDTRPAQKSMQDAKDIQAKTDEMTRQVEQKAKQ